MGKYLSVQTPQVALTFILSLEILPWSRPSSGPICTGRVLCSQHSCYLGISPHHHPGDSYWLLFVRPMYFLRFTPSFWWNIFSPQKFLRKDKWEVSMLRPCVRVWFMFWIHIDLPQILMLWLHFILAFLITIEKFNAFLISNAFVFCPVSSTLVILLRSSCPKWGFLWLCLFSSVGVW